MQKLRHSNAHSLYLHIPFCKQKCNYCAFISFTNINDFENLYIDSLIKEIHYFKSTQNLKTIYIGGGTPNLLSIKNIKKIFSELQKNFHIEQNAEITMEFNPKISDLQYFKEIKSIGINRISLGAQSFNNKTLKILNRIHDKDDTLNTIKNIELAGFTNYSLDLIYGIFEQTITDIQEDLNIIKNINPPHISTYGLKIEKGTPFEKYNLENLPDEDLNADMYTLISKDLTEAGYTHYEISNFAKENLQSQHNLTYWHANEYLGLGVAAHGYINNTRYKNTENLQEYLNNPFKKEITSHNNLQEHFEEYIMLGLRLKEGINLDLIKEKFNIDLLKTKGNKIQNIISMGYGNLQNNYFNLTTKGFLISNYLINELLD